MDDKLQLREPDAPPPGIVPYQKKTWKTWLVAGSVSFFGG